MGFLGKITDALTPQLEPLRSGAAKVNEALAPKPAPAAPAPAAAPKPAPAPAASAGGSNDLVARGYQKQPDGTWMKEMNIDKTGQTQEPIGGK